MRSLWILISALPVAFTAFAQSDRGAITGAVADPAGAVVTNAAVEARNVETGVVYPVVTTATGNYSIGQLPAGGAGAACRRCTRSRSRIGVRHGDGIGAPAEYGKC